MASPDPTSPPAQDPFTCVHAVPSRALVAKSRGAVALVSISTETTTSAEKFAASSTRTLVAEARQPGMWSEPHCQCVFQEITESGVVVVVLAREVQRRRTAERRSRSMVATGDGGDGIQC
jgi:hypothetical protein